ncbi:MAG: type 1 glutamine amidotransferase domain-containing protein [Candidatus Wallbacteria bacterium]|nr:type 1 glutamine amidotransferase domain-containing protein [Candidatus Wallbacteria bacterium]
MNKKTAALAVLLLAALFTAGRLYWSSQAKKNIIAKILVVVSNVSEIPGRGVETGLWASELLEPLRMYRHAGLGFEIASPTGGSFTCDQKSYDTSFVSEVTSHYLTPVIEKYRKSMEVSLPLSSLNPDDYDALYIAGGCGSLWDLANDKTLPGIISDFHGKGKPVAAISQAAVCLCNVLDAKGLLLFRGYRVTGFSDREASLIDMADFPLSVEKKLKSCGFSYQAASPWDPNVVSDRKLITGQNPASVTQLMRILIQELIPPDENGVLYDDCLPDF